MPSSAGKKKKVRTACRILENKELVASGADSVMRIHHSAPGTFVPYSPSNLPAYLFFFFNDTATTEIYTLSLHDALPISRGWRSPRGSRRRTLTGVSAQP